MKLENIKTLTDTLANGLTVTYMPMSDSNTVSVKCVIDGGGRDDPDDKLGIAHFMEHMVYKGNQFLSVEEFNREIGVRGITTNAFTTRNNIVHWMTGVSTEAEWMLRNTCHLVTHPIFPEAEMELERKVVLNEFNFRRDQRDIAVYDNLHNVLFRDSDFKTMAVPTIGTPECVKSITRDDLLWFHRTRYCPANMHIFVGGNFDIDKMRDIIWVNTARWTGGDKRHEHVESRVVPMKLDAVEHHVEDQMCQILFGWKVAGTGSMTLEHLVVDEIIEAALFNGYLSKFHNNIREKNGLCYNCYGAFYRGKDVGICVAGGGTQLENVKTFTSLMMGEIESMRRDTTERKEVLIDAARNCLNKWTASCDSVDEIVTWTESLFRLTGHVYTLADMIRILKRNAMDIRYIDSVMAELHDKPAECYIMQAPPHPDV